MMRDDPTARAPPPHHAEGVSSTRRGEGSGVGVTQARDVSDGRPPVTPRRDRAATVTLLLHPTPNPSPSRGGEARRRHWSHPRHWLAWRVAAALAITTGGLGASLPASAQSAAPPSERPSASDAAPAKSDRRAARAASYAKRFAAKEACAKALGTGFRRGVFFRDLGVVNLPSGKPSLQLTGGALKRLQAMTPAGYEAQIDLALTDEYPIAQATVVISANPVAAR